jgi:hypothetical protein
LPEATPYVHRFIGLIHLGKMKRRGLMAKKKELLKFRTFNLLISEGSMITVNKIK